MNSRQQEEIESLRAIYCKEGELLEKQDAAGCSVSVKFDLEALRNCRDMQSGSEAVLNFFMPADYPEQALPQISLKCLFLRSEIQNCVTQQLENRAKELLGEPSILDLCFFAQEILQQKAEECVAAASSVNNSATQLPSLQTQELDSDNSDTKEKSHASSDDSQSVINKVPTLTFNREGAVANDSSGSHGRLRNDNTNSNEKQTAPQSVTTLLHLDHMRSKTNYVKLIKKWVSELGLTGRLVFCQKIILILLQGESQSTKEYVVRNRTVNVDVDSKGRSCKERMLAVLCEVPMKESNRLKEFSVLELQTVGEMSDLFANLSLSEIYEEFVQPLVHKQGTRGVNTVSRETRQHKKKQTSS